MMILTASVLETSQPMKRHAIAPMRPSAFHYLLTLLFIVALGSMAFAHDTTAPAASGGDRMKVLVFSATAYLKTCITESVIINPSIFRIKQQKINSIIIFLNPI